MPRLASKVVARLAVQGIDELLSEERLHFFHLFGRRLSSRVLVRRFAWAPPNLVHGILWELDPRSPGHSLIARHPRNAREAPKFRSRPLVTFLSHFFNCRPWSLGLFCRWNVLLTPDCSLSENGAAPVLEAFAAKGRTNLDRCKSTKRPHVGRISLSEASRFPFGETLGAVSSMVHVSVEGLGDDGPFHGVDEPHPDEIPFDLLPSFTLHQPIVQPRM